MRPAVFRTAVAVAALAAALIALPGCSDEAEGQPVFREMRPESSGSGEKVTLRPNYPPGTYLMGLNTDIETRIEAEEGKITATVSQAIDATQKVSEPDASGNKRISIRFDSLKMDIKAGPQKISYDSTRSSNPGLPRPFQEAMGHLLSTELEVTLRPDGTMTDPKGIDRMLQSLSGQPMSRKALENLLEGNAMEKLWGGMEQHYPETPVGVGAIWHGSSPVPLGQFGAHKTEIEYELTRIREEAGRKIGVIDVYAALQIDEPIRTVDGGGTISDTSVIMQGEAEIDVETGMVLYMQLRITGGMKATISRPFGPPVSSEAGFEGEIVVDVTEL